MGSKIHIELEGNSPEICSLLRKARKWFLEWESIFSRFNPQSELNRLNNRKGHAFQASETLWNLLYLALQAAKETDGIVNPAVLSSLESSGYALSFEKMPSINVSIKMDQITQPISPSFMDIILDVSGFLIILPERMRLDLGGFAKGWSADQAVIRLAESSPVLVDAGGDIRVSGPRLDGQPWKIGLVDPYQPDESLLVLELGQFDSLTAVATSGIQYHQWMVNRELRHHLIDPRTGKPAQSDFQQVTIVSKSALDAEIAAKVVFILGSVKGLGWLDAHPDNFGVLIYCK